MHAGIDLDIIKYKIGFACERDVYTDGENDFIIKQVKGNGMSVAPFPKGAVVPYPALRTKAAVCEELGLTHSRLDVDELSHCLHSVKLMLRSIIKMSGASTWAGYLSKGECFRHRAAPSYKANRKDAPKPALIDAIQDYLIKEWDAVVCTDIEADDAMGIMQCQDQSETIICTIDKDLDCIPGWHYNWDKQSVYEVSEEQSVINFWQQVLSGDNVDNIIGLKGVGPARAKKLLSCYALDEMRAFCLNAYLDAGRTEEDFALNCKMLWILRKPLNETYGDDDG